MDRNNKLKIIHWNINNKHMVNMPNMISIEIIKEEADVVVLTEFLKTPDYYQFVDTLEEYGYKVFLDDRKPKENIRQVLIAVKTCIMAENSNVKLTTLYDNEDNIFANKKANESIEEVLKKQNPNFLSVSINLSINNSCYSLIIIGTRIRIGMKKLSKDDKINRENEQRFRKAQFLNLLKEINNLQQQGLNNIIVTGDFNISPGFNGDYWNFEKDFKQIFKNEQFNVFTPENEYSPFKSSWKMDHLILSNNIECQSYEYYKNNIWPVGINYPDHAILRASIKL